MSVHVTYRAATGSNVLVDTITIRVLHTLFPVPVQTKVLIEADSLQGPKHHDESHSVMSAGNARL